MRTIVFIGFMGAGKTKAAGAAAPEGVDPVDSDALLEAELGMPIGEFFEREGEGEFRRREEAFVTELLARANGAPIALGGGSVLSETVRERLADHLTVWLDVGADDAWERVAESDRPLARDRDAFHELHEARRPLYAELADAVVPARKDVLRRALPTLEKLRGLKPGVRMAWARSASGEYPALVGPGLITKGTWKLDGRPFLVTDENVGPLYGAGLGELAGEVSVAAGERAKTLAEVERVLRELARLGMTREHELLALGGGVVGDLAGFCAAIYQRGVPVIQLPTTLVAQVDSAYGGKTGVDLPEAKNYAGAYHQPAAVIADTATLATLPEAELRAGFVEVLKTGLIAGGELWERVRATEELDPGALDDVIFACARTKLEIVAEDERDSGRRAVLNLGHTVGHGIEAASGYARYRHGEAVGLGLLAALRLSGAGELRAEVLGLLDRHGLPTTLDPEVSVENALAALARDKKRTEAGVGFVLLERPGEPQTGQLVADDQVRAAVEELVG